MYFIYLIGYKGEVPCELREQPLQRNAYAFTIYFYFCFSNKKSRPPNQYRRFKRKRLL